MSDDIHDKARRMIDEGKNTITAGVPGEQAIAKWESGGVVVRQMPDDEHGLLRISIGGLPNKGYLVFRGDRGQCRALLKRALRALEK